MSIGIVTDSNSQFPEDLARRFGVEIVPLTVTIDGVDHAEGSDLSADEFYARFAVGTPQVSTAAPSPGRFARVYESLAASGIDEILSIHIGATVSGTLNAARIGAAASPVPVRLVDTGTASFGISCCVWEAAVAIAAGATVDAAAAVAERVAPTVGNIFVVGALDLVRAGGRLATGTEDVPGTPVLSLVDGEIQRLAMASNVAEATDAMVEFIRRGGEQLRVAVGVADAEAAPLSAALHRRCEALDEVLEVVQYRIGPSVGAHTGPGTAGAFFWPVTA